MVASAPSRPSPMPAIPVESPYEFTGRPLYYFVVEDQGTERELRLQDHRARWLDLLDGRRLQRDPAKGAKMKKATHKPENLPPESGGE